MLIFLTEHLQNNESFKIIVDGIVKYEHGYIEQESKLSTRFEGKIEILLEKGKHIIQFAA